MNPTEYRLQEPMLSYPDIYPRTSVPEDTNPRLAAILHLHGEHLWEAALRLDARGVSRTACTGPADVLARLARADPHPRGAFTQWLVNTYVRGGMRLEDCGKARETLELFMARRAFLPRDQRDLGQHATLAGVWNSVAPDAAAETPISNREMKRRLRDEARRESDILLEREDGLTVVVPMSIRAARWWGRGTRWCTAADKDNAYREYDEDAPLIVIVMPDGAKIQMFASSSDFQMMDASDAPVTANAAEKMWDTLRPLVEWALSRNGGALQVVPEIYRTRETYMKAVSTSGARLHDVPRAMRDQAMCLAAISDNPHVMRSVPVEMITREICMHALDAGPHGVSQIPHDIMDREMWLHAIGISSGFLKYMPSHMLDRDMMLASVRQWGHLAEVPVEHRDAEICREAVRVNGWSIIHVPNRLLTRELCAIATASNPGLLEHIPARFRTRAMWLLAVTHDGGMLDRLSRSERDREICLAAVRSRGSALRWVPRTENDLEMCLAAAECSDLDMEFVPEAFRDQVAAAMPPREAYPQFWNDDPTRSWNDDPTRSWKDQELDGLREALLELLPSAPSAMRR